MLSIGMTFCFNYVLCRECWAVCCDAAESKSNEEIYIMNIMSGPITSSGRLVSCDGVLYELLQPTIIYVHLVSKQSRVSISKTTTF